MFNYNELKELLFKRALMYRYAKGLEIEGANHSFFAVHEVIVEAGLEDEFQEYRKKRISAD